MVPAILIRRRTTYRFRVYLKPAVVDAATVPPGMKYSDETLLPLASEQDVKRLVHSARGGKACPLGTPASGPHPWRVIEDEFLVLTASNLRRSSVDTMLTPCAAIDDGAGDVLIVRGPHVTRWQLLRTFLGLETGAHVQFPWVEHYRIEEMVVEPLDDVFTVNMSGEECLPLAPVYHMHMHKGAAVFEQ